MKMDFNFKEAKMKLLQFIFILVIAIPMSQAYNITTFPISIYNSNTATMNAALGIDDSFIIEDFEDTTLIDGLSIEFEDGQTTPNISSADYYWDGSKHLENYYTNNKWVDVTLNFDEPVSVLGFGASWFDTDNGINYIYLNGSNTPLTDLDSLPNFHWDRNGSRRNFYIIIEAEIGESINSIFLPSSNNGSDRFNIDHLALKTVPEPANVLLFLIFGLIATSGICKK